MLFFKIRTSDTPVVHSRAVCLHQRERERAEAEEEDVNVQFSLTSLWLHDLHAKTHTHKVRLLADVPIPLFLYAWPGLLNPLIRHKNSGTSLLWLLFLFQPHA